MQKFTVPSFSEHVQKTRARFQLDAAGRERDPPSLDTAASPYTENIASVTERISTPPVPPLRLSTPSAYFDWTASEKNAFFRALGVHSRWRPDLIAAAVPTRNAWQVQEYLVALEDEAGRLEGGEDGYWSVSDSETDLEQDTESCAELAYEVSEAWIAAEEAVASHVIQEDNLALLEHAGKDSTGESDAEGNATPESRPRSQSRKRAPEESICVPEGEGTTQVDQWPNSPQNACPNLGRAGSARERPSKRARTAITRDGYMMHLEDAHLVVLDAILRESEEALIDASCEQNQGIGNTPFCARGESSGREHEQQIQDSNTATGVPKVEPSNTTIDSVLSAISCTPVNDRTCVAPSIPVAPHRPAALDIQSPSIAGVPPISRTNLGAVDEQFTRQTQVLSPVSRRRLQKRLYMRKRRAKLQDKRDASHGATEDAYGTDGRTTLDLRRLKSGRKPKTQETAPISSAHVMDANSNGDKPTKPSRGTRGLTLRYKLTARFGEIGIDATYLRTQDMDLFHLSALGRLRDLYDALEHGSSEDEAAAGQDQTEDSLPRAIDARLIQHLQVAVVLFVTIVIHHATVWKERQMRLKQRTLAWKEGDVIVRYAIEHALQTLGVRCKSHKEHFAAVHSRTKAEFESGEITAGSAESRGVEGGMARERDAPAAPLPTPHQDLYARLVHPPPAVGLHPLDCISFSYMQEATRRPNRLVEENGELDEDLMPDETDEEALEEELRLDEELDEQDMESAKEYEQRLWEAIGGERDS